MGEKSISSTKFQDFPLVAVIDLDKIHGHGLEASKIDRPSLIAQSEFFHKIYN